MGRMVGHRTGGDYRKRFRVGVEFPGMGSRAKIETTDRECGRLKCFLSQRPAVEPGAGLRFIIRLLERIILDALSNYLIGSVQML